MAARVLFAGKLSGTPCECKALNGPSATAPNAASGQSVWLTIKVKNSLIISSSNSSGGWTFRLIAVTIFQSLRRRTVPLAASRPTAA